MKNTFRVGIAAAIFATTGFSAGIINIGTATSSNWLITGAGASNAVAMANSNIPGTISISDNSKADGTFISGGSAASFNTGPAAGFWYADYMFILPGDAINIVLNFSGLTADDRVVLKLNGTDVGNEAVDGAGSGLMNFGAGDGLYSFSAGAGIGTITTGFNIGGGNLIRLVVNNTGTGRTGSTQGFITGADATAAGIIGTVSYDQVVIAETPEPGSISLILLGFAPLAWRLRRRA